MFYGLRLMRVDGKGMISMKYISAPILICLGFCMATQALGSEDELSLYNPFGEATAYIAEDLTIYLWSGTPVAYLSEDKKGGFHIYGFNGKHLGWFANGAVWNHKGNAVGAVAEIYKRPLATRPFKGFKKFKPYKAIKENAPFRPEFTDEWSKMSFKYFLMMGASDG
jgi:hypothetical protein